MPDLRDGPRSEGVESPDGRRVQATLQATRRLLCHALVKFRRTCGVGRLLCAREWSVADTVVMATFALGSTKAEVNEGQGAHAAATDHSSWPKLYTLSAVSTSL